MPKFRVLIGKHAEKDAAGTVRVYEAGTDHDVIDTNFDLLTLNHPSQRKFERLDEPKSKVEGWRLREEAPPPAPGTTFPHAPTVIAPGVASPGHTTGTPAGTPVSTTPPLKEEGDKKGTRK